MKKMRILLAVVFLSAVGVSRADSGVDLAKENAELKKRVDKLETELAELKKMVMKQGQPAEAAKAEAKPVQPTAAPQAEQKPTTMPQLSEADMKKILDAVQKETAKKKMVWSDLDIQVYGNIRLDASYDSSQVEPGNYIKWVRRETVNKNDNQFDMTANQTRLGMRLNGPDDGQIKTSGLVEIDFYGSGGGENTANPRMRHAYMKLEWPAERFEILAGQTWDVISPLNPYTLNDTVLWWTGNIGYRRPQLRLTKSYALSNDVDLKLEGAAVRTIGRKDSSSIDSGSSEGYPGVQGRGSLTFPFFGPKPTTVGVSGHWAREEYDASTSPAHPQRKFESWSANLDLTQPIYKWLTLKGEMFTGLNLDAYLGGIGQGVRNLGLGTTASPNNYDKEIASNGGWAAFELGPWDKWRFNVGAGIDSPSGDDLAGSGSGLDIRTRNQAIFGNMIYSINKNAEVGLELSHWRTEYQGSGDAEAVRLQTAFMYKF
jgi:hypothetical protein